MLVSVSEAVAGVHVVLLLHFDSLMLQFSVCFEFNWFLLCGFNGSSM